MDMQLIGGGPPEKVGETTTAVQKAVHETEDEIPPEKNIKSKLLNNLGH